MFVSGVGFVVVRVIDFYEVSEEIRIRDNVFLVVFIKDIFR